MTPTTEYLRSRYVAMQVALFLILIGTVTLAHWVSHRHASILSSGAPISLGDFTVPLPQDWATEEKKSPSSIQIIAEDPDDPGRHLTAIFQQLREPVQPMDYLLRSGLVAGPANGEQMTADGYPGAYVEMMRILQRDNQRVLIKDIVACVVLPSGQVLTLQLTGPGQVEETDRQLMQETLTNLRIKPQPKPTTESSPQEWEGI